MIFFSCTVEIDMETIFLRVQFHLTLIWKFFKYIFLEWRDNFVVLRGIGNCLKVQIYFYNIESFHENSNNKFEPLGEK